MADLSALSDADLMALKGGDLSKVSDAGLMALKGVQERAPQPAQPLAEQQMPATGPATMNPSIAAQGVKVRANMTPPESVTDPRYPAYANAQQGSDTMDVVGGLAGGLAGGILKPGASAMQWGARRLMQSALKPSPLEGQKNIDRAVETLLKEGANVSRGGVEKLRGIGTGLNSEVEGILAASPETIPKGAPATTISAEIAKNDANNPLPAGPRAAMESVLNEYLSNPLVATDIPLPKAQQYKQTLYQVLKDDYGKQLPAGQTVAQKALARGLREYIEQKAPGVVPLNERASDIWNAVNTAEHRALAAGNKDPAGLAALFAGQHPIGAGSFIANRSELLKSLLARGMYSEVGKRAPGAAMGAALGANMGNSER